MACAVADDREARAAFLALRLPRRDHAGTGLKPEQFRPALGPAGLRRCNGPAPHGSTRARARPAPDFLLTPHWFAAANTESLSRVIRSLRSTDWRIYFCRC